MTKPYQCFPKYLVIPGNVSCSSVDPVYQPNPLFLVRVCHVNPIFLVYFLKLFKLPAAGSVVYSFT